MYCKDRQNNHINYLTTIKTFSHLTQKKMQAVTVSNEFEEEDAAQVNNYLLQEPVMEQAINEIVPSYNTDATTKLMKRILEMTLTME